jgi:alcohol dehydrogenase class IV
MRFEFATATQIIFGEGRLREAGPLAAGLGRKVLLVTGADPARAAPLRDGLAAAGLEAASFSVSGEPTLENTRQGTALARLENCDMVISMGGGSVIDAGKAISAMLTNPGEIEDYLEVVGKGWTIENQAAPFIAIPTTAGTGSEVTRNAVIGVPDQRVKVSMRSLKMLPTVALVDPELTFSMPPELTASTGLDALTQLIEPFVSPRANPLTDALCLEGIRRASKALPAAYQDGSRPARLDMSAASLFGGLALANAGLGAVHGFAGPLGGMVPGPHGAICAALLAPVMEVNLRALQIRQPDSPALKRYDLVAQALTGSSTADADDGLIWIQNLVGKLSVPRLSEYGLKREDLPAVVEKAARASSMKANPIPLTDEELHEILEIAT